ncbi:unnamed protein product, partial [Ceratitis capitata]
TQKNDLCFEQVILTAQENLDTMTDKFDEVAYSIASNAEHVMSSLLIHPENGPVVMEELELNFGRLEFLIKVQMQKIQDFLPIYEGHLEQHFLNQPNLLPDEGSSVTLLQEAVSNAIGVRGRIEPLSLKWYNGNQTTENSRVFNLDVHLDDSRVSITEMTVYVGPDEPIAVTTKLGWVAYGSAPPVSASVQCLLVRKSPTPKQPHQLGKPGSENPK